MKFSILGIVNCDGCRTSLLSALSWKSSLKIGGTKSLWSLNTSMARIWRFWPESEDFLRVLKQIYLFLVNSHRSTSCLCIRFRGIFHVSDLFCCSDYGCGTSTQVGNNCTVTRKTISLECASFFHWYLVLLWTIH